MVKKVGWTIRDADYDVDHLGYGLIKSKTILYHADLLDKAKTIAKGDDPSPDDVKLAEAEYNREVYEKLKHIEIQKKGRLPGLKDIAVAFGSALIGIFVGKLIEVLVMKQPIEQMHWAYWVSLVAGVICFVPYLRSET